MKILLKSNMRLNMFQRWISVMLCVVTAMSYTLASLTARAAVLQDDYENEFEQQDKTYDSLGILEDQYDLIEPANNKYPIISPSSEYDQYYPPLFKGTYEEVEKYFKENGMTDGMPVVPPTKIKAEKFLGYSSYDFNDVVASVNGRQVKAYQVAANAIMAGCSAEHLPICIAFAEALGDKDYLDSLKSGKLTPMMYVNGPVARQIGIDNTQGMTTEETNIAIARFMELALINLAGIKRTNAFGNVQPLVFSENDETCLKIGWTPHHVEKGYHLNDNVITATSFAMWGNNVTPATDLPEEIMKVIAWDITEKNLGALGSASVSDNANTHRLIFITESVAAALAAQYKSKDVLENALVETARRPLWMRTYAYYYANTGGALSKSFSDVYNELKTAPKEDAKSTVSPPWMNGITYSNIDTVATMTKGNTDIIITGDSSRNKTQVIPGGISVSREVKLSDKWDKLVTSMNYFPISDFYLVNQDHTVTPPENLPSVLTNGTYRILDSATGSKYLTRAGRLYFDSATDTLYYYAQGASAKASVVLDPETDATFISYLTYLGYNSSFTVDNGKLKDITIRFSSNDNKLKNNTIALTDKSFGNLPLTLHANNTENSNAAGGLAKNGAVVELSDTVTSYTVSLDGDIVMGDTTNSDFVNLNGDQVTVDTTVETGATAMIGAANPNGTYRTMTFVNGGDGTYTVTYHTANTLSKTASVIYLKTSLNGIETTDAFEKTDNDDVVTITKELAAGNYELMVYHSGTDKWYGKDETTIEDTANRLVLTAAGSGCKLNATGGQYEFKYELSTNRLSVYHSENNLATEQPAIPATTEQTTETPATTEQTTETPATTEQTTETPATTEQTTETPTTGTATTETPVTESSTTETPATEGSTQVSAQPEISDAGEGTEGKSVNELIEAMKADELEGAAFSPLNARATKTKKKSVTLSWKKVKGAKKYIVYANTCGTKNKFKEVKTLGSAKKSLKVTKVAGKSVKKGTYYKFLIIALDSKNKVLAISKTIYAATTGGKAGNYKNLTVKKTTVTLAKKGKKFHLKGKAVVADKEHKVKKYRNIEYESTNPKVAKVTSKGVIVAKKKGICYVYAYLQSGVYKKVKVVVKK